MPEKTAFRNSSGARYTRSMFWETSVNLPIEDRVSEPRFTLMTDKPGLVNFRKAYVQLGDPSGYQMAQRYLEDYDHWRLLMRSPWFKAAKVLWDEELDAKLSSEGMQAIRELADGGEHVPVATQLSAAKYLADKTFRKAPSVASRGRPSKEEVAGNLKQATAETADTAADAARIRLVR